ncbi:unnamed protein product [Ectocarpus sp. 6 AP-2014]
MKHLSAYPKLPTLESAIQARFRALRETEKIPRQHTSAISSISRTNNAYILSEAISGAITHCLQRGPTAKHVMPPNQPATPGSFDSDMSQQACLLPPALALCQATTYAHRRKLPGRSAMPSYP